MQEPASAFVFVGISLKNKLTKYGEISRNDFVESMHLQSHGCVNHVMNLFLGVFSIDLTKYYKTRIKGMKT